MKLIILKEGFKKDPSYNDNIEFFRKEDWGVSIIDGDFTFYYKGRTVKKIKKDQQESLEEFIKQNFN